MAQRVDLRPMAGLSDERIVVRDGAVVAQAQNFAAQRVGILRVVAGGDHVEHAIGAERDTRRAGLTQVEDVLAIDQRVAVPLRSRDRDGALAGRSALV